MPSSNLDRSRIGLDYYPDTMHYRESDLAVWLPEMINLGARWVTLQSPSERAIPEPFIKGLIQAGISPILHFQFPTHHSKIIDWIQFLFNVYARWGVKYVALFDRPNVKSSWSSTSWTQNDLVERFLDLFIPISEILVQNELTPIFPPLEPGGDYWDLSFLRAALRRMCRRGTAWRERVLGSVSEKLLQLAPCPVLVAH